METQERMQHTFSQQLQGIQEQLTKLQAFCDRQTDLDKMLRENLVITKETFKTVRKLFGEGLSRLEEEMGNFLPISSLDEMQQVENKLIHKENESAMVSLLQR